MHDEILGNLDFPLNNQENAAGAIIVKGWAFSKFGNNLGIEIYVDGNHLDSARWGLARYDVYRKYGTEIAYESGFISRVTTNSLSLLKHELRVIARSADGEKSIGSVSIIKRNPKKGERPVVYPVPAGEVGQFKDKQKRVIESFIEFGKLEPNHKVLEVGCGMGRLAQPLTSFLNNEGEYFSFDTIKFAIDYCKENISSRFPNFHFTFADIFNQMYNINAQFKASEYKFPYENETFNFVFLFSVFTHLIPNDMEHYLSEISRVLKYGGRCFITFLLFNEQVEKLIESGKINDFKHKFLYYRLRDKNIPEKAITYEIGFIKELFRKNGLPIEEPIHYGWAVEKSPIGQDIVIAIKK